jgi:putative membrane protein
MQRPFTRAILCVTAIGFAAGCAPEEGPPPPMDTAAGAVDSAPTTAATAVATLLSDENVFAFLDTSFAAILELDRLGQQRATSPQVKALANRAVSQHALHRRSAAALAERLNIVRTLPDRDIVKDHAEVMQELRGKTGADFDRAFLDRWVDVHEELLDEIGDARVNLRNENVRTFLAQLRASVEADLKAGRDLRDRVGEGQR